MPAVDPAEAAVANPPRRLAGALRHLLFLGNFGCAKVAIYAIPLLLAARAPVEVYGAVEFALATGLFAASLVVGAPLSGAIQRYLVDNEGEVLDELALLAGLGGLLGVLIWLPLHGLVRPAVALIAITFGAATLHNALSALFRMRAWRNCAAWADGTATIVAGLMIAADRFIAGKITLDGLAAGYVTLNFAVAGGALAFVALRRRPNLLARLRRSAAIGLPMTAGGALAMWLGVNGRVLTGLLTPDAVAVYSFTFRVAGLALGLHQLAVTSLFARLYSAETQQADRMLALFLAGVSAMMGLMMVLAPPLAGLVRIEALAGGGVPVFRRLLLPVALQVYFWIGFAMLQLRINRSGLAAALFRPLLVVTLGGTALIVGLVRALHLGGVGLSWAVAAQSLAYFLAEVVVLARAGLTHRRLGMVAAAGSGTLVALGLLASAIWP